MNFPLKKKKNSSLLDEVFNCEAENSMVKNHAVKNMSLVCHSSVETGKIFLKLFLRL